MQETLIQRIERARRLLAKGTMPPGDLDRLLAEVQAVLSQVEMVQDPVTNALKSLTYSELEAVEAVAAALPAEDGGLVTASKIADQHGFTRSIIVSAIRKFESAGVIQARSLGMKGTMIKLLGGLTRAALRDRIHRFAGRAA